MRFALLVGGLLVLTTLVAAAPTASAVGTCTEFTDERCPHTACVGYSWSYPDPYYTCQYWVDTDPCEYFHCGP